VQEFGFRVDREQKESQRKKIEADGIAAFQQTVSQGISDSYLRAQSNNTKIVVIGSGKDGLPIMLGNFDTPPARQTNAADGNQAGGERTLGTEASAERASGPGSPVSAELPATSNFGADADRATVTESRAGSTRTSGAGTTATKLQAPGAGVTSAKPSSSGSGTTSAKTESADGGPDADSSLTTGLSELQSLISRMIRAGVQKGGTADKPSPDGREPQK
jgi:hypothetical protein